eukprot:c20735_g1_i3 orf=1576-2001(+)
MQSTSVLCVLYLKIHHRSQQKIIRPLLAQRSFDRTRPMIRLTKNQKKNHSKISPFYCLLSCTQGLENKCKRQTCKNSSQKQYNLFGETSKPPLFFESQDVIMKSSLPSLSLHTRIQIHTNIFSLPVSNQNSAQVIRKYKKD